MDLNGSVFNACKACTHLLENYLKALFSCYRLNMNHIQESNFANIPHNVASYEILINILNIKIQLEA